MNYDDQRADMIFNLFVKFCLVIVFVFMIGIGFMLWMKLKG
jgi:hypothetical protein